MELTSKVQRRKGKIPKDGIWGACHLRGNQEETKREQKIRELEEPLKSIVKEVKVGVFKKVAGD